MGPHGRSSCPDSPHPDDGKSNDWLVKPYPIINAAVGFLIIILGITIFLGYRQFKTAMHSTLTSDKTTINLLADLILEHNKATMGILQSYAQRPRFIDAVNDKNLAEANRHLSDLKKNAEIDLTFVTDTRGILWANFPVFPEAIGRDLSSRDWYRGTSSQWKPYISTVFKLIVGDKPLAVSVCVPVLDKKERVIGILATSQRLGFLAAAIQRVPLIPYTAVTVLDRAGHILYSNKYPYQEDITKHRSFPIIEAAMKSKEQLIEMNDPQQDQEKIYLSVVPVGDIGWSVIVERSLKDIYRSEIRRFIEIGAIAVLLYLLIIFFLIYLRKIFLLRKTEELLQTEIKLRLSKESERETRDYLDKLIGYANAPIIVWDPQFLITRFNRAFEDLTGLKTEEVLGKGIDLLFPEDRRKECLGHILQTTGGERWEVIEIPILHRNGSVRTVLWNSATIYGPDGKTAIATIAQGQDITERKRVEEERAKFEAQNRQLQKAESLGRMAGAIAHHFNNQLFVVIGNLEMAMMNLPEAALLKKNIRDAMHASKQAAEMSSRMLTYLGQSYDKREPLDLSAVCRWSLPMLQAIMPGNVQLETDLPSPGPVISANAIQIQQVLTNIATNAWEAVGESPGAIHLSVETVPPADIPTPHNFPVDWQPQDLAYACMKVRDDGCGIVEQDIEKIFDPFFSTKFTGRGMGLAVVLGIVRAHRGAVTVQNGPGRGSIFRVYFPVTAEEVGRATPAPERRGQHGAAGRRWGDSE